jgi:hypothetical protein
VADLKRRVTQLERENKRLKAIQAKQQTATAPTPAEEGKRGRLTSKGIRTLRKKLQLMASLTWGNKTKFGPICLACSTDSTDRIA